MSPEWIFLSSWSGLSFPIALCWEALSPKGEAVLAARMLCSNARGQGASDHLSQGGGHRGRLLNTDTKVNSDYRLESVWALWLSPPAQNRQSFEICSATISRVSYSRKQSGNGKQYTSPTAATVLNFSCTYKADSTSLSQIPPLPLSGAWSWPGHLTAQP